MLSKVLYFINRFLLKRVKIVRVEVIEDFDKLSQLNYTARDELSDLIDKSKDFEFRMKLAKFSDKYLHNTVEVKKAYSEISDKGFYYTFFRRYY